MYMSVYTYLCSRKIVNSKNPIHGIMKKIILCGALGSLLFTSCFKDEPLNSEADILQAYISLSEDQIQELFYNECDTLVNVLSDDEDIIFPIKSDTVDISALAPRFTTTAGATISPASGSVQDFSNGPITYTVTSQNGAYKKLYHVSFEFNEFTPYHGLEFPTVKVLPGKAPKKYHEWPGLCSANAGYMYVAGDDPNDYPSVATDSGYIGKGVILRTKDTGAWGVMAGKRIAAGNLFLGKFDTSKALLQTLQATQFGLPINQLPTGFSCWYKYTPGDVYKDKTGNVIPDKIDECAIYAVFYRNQDDTGKRIHLDGTNIMTSPLIIGMAYVGEGNSIPATAEWTELRLNFSFKQSIDPVILKNQGYSLAFIASASALGDHFEGAVGSELYIDEINFYFEE